MKKAVIYCRTATWNDDEHGKGISQQEQECRAYCESEEMVVAGVYADRGTSGMTLKRPGFREMVQHLLDERIDVVVVTAQDRLSRSFRDYAGFVNWCRTQKIEVHVPCMFIEDERLTSAQLQATIIQLERRRHAQS